ncbi:serine/threonine-protein kinase [Nocardiopsis coralliicola]
MSTNGPRLLAGRYRLTGELGRGGMGRVWRAWDTALERHVALKQVLLPDGAEGDRPQTRARVLREAKSAVRIAHRAVVTVHDVFDDGGVPWVVMELIPGHPLSELIAGGALPADRVARIGAELLAGLRAAHGAGVVHRDIKPANVMVDGDDRVVITDFGIATFDGAATVTRGGAVFGSPEFIAPERLMSLPATPAADLWSAGVTLYAAAAGQSPFRRPAMAAVIRAVADGPIPPLPQGGPLGRALAALLQRDPDERPTADTALRMLTAAPDDPLPRTVGVPLAPPAAGSTAPAEPAGPAGRLTPMGEPPRPARRPGAAEATAGAPAAPDARPDPSGGAGQRESRAPGAGAPGYRLREPVGPGPEPPLGPREAPRPAPAAEEPPEPASRPQEAAPEAADARSADRPQQGSPEPAAAGRAPRRLPSRRTLAAVCAAAAALLLLAAGGLAAWWDRGAGQPAAPASASSPDGSATPAEVELAEFRTGAFTVGYPEGWSVYDGEIDEDGTGRVFFASPSEDHGIWVSAWGEEEDTSSLAVLERSNGRIKADGDPDVERLARVPEEELPAGWDVDEASVTELRLTNGSWPTPERAYTEWAALAGGEVSTLSLNVPAGTLDEHRPVFDAVLASFAPG